MKTIIIQIQVPDGVNVNVTQGGQSSQSDDRPFVERPAPPEPDGVCPEHGTDWRLVPAGTSKKTGKRYNAFWACPERGCNEKPQREQGMTDVTDGLPF